MTKHRPKKDFSFGERAEAFDAHIRASIPGYKELTEYTVDRSLDHVQRGTTVVDIGCSTGRTLAEVRRVNQVARPNVDYLGIDIEPRFRRRWERYQFANLRFEVADVLSYEFTEISFACCLMTMQFLAPRHKMQLLKRIRGSLIDGGALVIAEKTLAETPREEARRIAAYADYKRRMGFSADEILDKQRSLRGQMTTMTESELRSALCEAGFREIEPFWRNLMFTAFVVQK